jgi:hypothetical protein
LKETFFWERDQIVLDKILGGYMGQEKKSLRDLIAFGKLEKDQL